jgi:acyl carrier protein phosphodiesterase
MDVETRVRALEDRMSELEDEVKGEKTVTRQILQLVKDNQNGIADLNEKFDGLRSEFDGLRSEFDGLRSDFDGLRSDMPDIIAKAVSSVLRN